MDITKSVIKNIECLGEVDDYVYDISIADQDPYFFANDVLVHNTDSVYFSAWPTIKNEVEAGNIPWDKDICIQMYDAIADKVNDSFPTMMARSCNCPLERGAIIRGGRELVASTGIYIKKKRYAVLIYDAEGTRLDQYDEETAKKKGVHYKHGKVKAMGLDLKRSDTPRIVQDFLSDLLFDVLTGVDKNQVIDKVREFKTQFAEIPAWEKGTPKRVNNLTKYTKEFEQTGGCRVGHVMAAINWNRLKKMYNDNYSPSIVDGMKVIVCKLKNNPLDFTSVAYPTDILHIPDWFKQLPFDNDLMESTIVTKKVENLLGVLKWDIANNTEIKTTFSSLFTIEG